MRKLIVFAVLSLAACGTPQEQCINRETREIRHLQGMLEEIEGNLARGYAYERWGYTHFHDTPRGKFFENLIRPVVEQRFI